MTVPVHFPDGAVRQVPGQLRQVTGSPGTAGGGFEKVPLHCDPHWQYERSGDRWVARRRQVVVTALCPPQEEWWWGIAPMADDRPNPSPLVDRTGGHDEAMRPAA